MSPPLGRRRGRMDHECLSDFLQLAVHKPSAFAHPPPGVVAKGRVSPLCRCTRRGEVWDCAYPLAAVGAWRPPLPRILGGFPAYGPRRWATLGAPHLAGYLSLMCEIREDRILGA